MNLQTEMHFVVSTSLLARFTRVRSTKPTRKAINQTIEFYEPSTYRTSESFESFRNATEIYAKLVNEIR